MPGAPLHILMVADSFWPVIGGSETVDLEISRRLVTRGHRVTVLTERRDPAWVPHEVYDGIHITRVSVDCGNALRHILSAYRSMQAGFLAIHKKHPVDVLMFHPNLAPLGVNGCKVANSLPRVSMFYAPWHQEFMLETEARERINGRLDLAVWNQLKSAVMARFQKNYLYRSDRVVVLSTYSQNLLRGFLPDLPPERICRIQAGVDLERFRPAVDKPAVRRHLDLPADRFVLLTVRRLVARMGIENLLKAIAAVLPYHPDIYLTVVGDGYLRPTLEKMVEQMDLARAVRFVGRVNDSDLALYYQAADLFVLPSKSLEGFGLITVEALASGIPVLGTPVGATQEILSRLDPQLLFSGTDPEGIANTLHRYLTECREDRTLAERCRAYTETYYSWERTVDDLEDIYNQLIEEDKQT